MLIPQAIVQVGGGDGGVGGWFDAGETWTYASADDPTFTFTIAGVDLTGKYSPGMKIKLTQTTPKYFIITAVAFSTDTTITIYGGTDYDLANAAITSPFYSLVKAPFGFPLNPSKWTVTVTDTSNATQASPTNGTWYNLGSITISIPIGCWNVYYSVVGGCDRSTASAGQEAYITLSTANNSEVDKLWSAFLHIGDASAGGKGTNQTVYRENVLNLAAKTSYFLNCMADITSLNIYFRGDIATTVIRAVCAYL